MSLCRVVGYHPRDMQRLWAFNYVGPFSIGGRGWNDVQCGMEHNMCASNDARGLRRGDWAVISSLVYRGVRWFIIVRIMSDDLGPTTLWSDKGGSDWKHSYRCYRYTQPLSTSHPALQEILTGYTPRQISDMFSTHHCAGGPDKSGYMKILKKIARDERFRRQRAPPPPSAPAPPPTAPDAPVQSQ
jgi:hypothetical protein